MTILDIQKQIPPLCIHNVVILKLFILYQIGTIRIHGQNFRTPCSMHVENLVIHFLDLC